MRENSTIKISYRPSLIIALAIILVLTMLAQLTFLSIFGTRGKEVAQIRREQKQLILKNELLEAEINRQQSLMHVKKIATEELGMIPIEEIEYIAPNNAVSAKNPLEE